jgi:hypothetical protein
VLIHSRRFIFARDVKARYQMVNAGLGTDRSRRHSRRRLLSTP